MHPKQKILILGAGFAGIYGARSIARELGDAADITIINKTNHFLFTPMLHEVASGGLGHHQVVESIREIIYGTPIRFLEAEVLSVDLAAKKVITSHGEREYDILIIALGATTNFFGTPGAAEHALTLKDLSDAIKLRNRIISQFEAAVREPDAAKQKEFLSFVIVGGGATGVELAAEVAEFAYKTFKKYYTQEFPCATPVVTLVQAGSELLPMFDLKTRAYAERSLRHHGVEILLNTAVSQISDMGATLASGTFLGARTVVWTAGVKAHTLVTANGELAKDAGGRIMAASTLEVEGYPGLFALGDNASVPNTHGTAYPMLAQVAERQARMLGRNVALFLKGEPLESFSYSLEGQLVSLGQFDAAGSVFGIHISGPIAWFIWRTVYLFKFISSSKKIRIALDWTMRLFYPRDVTRA